MKELIINESQTNQRLDKFLLKYINNAPKSFVYKMLRTKHIKLNDKKAVGSELLKCGDKINLYLKDETIEEFSQEITINAAAGEVKIVFEDENILVCDKESGILSHPDTAEDKDTTIDRLLAYLYKKGEYDPETREVFRPALCNRLDRNTSGLLILGKNLHAVTAINEAIKNKKIDKYYIAVVKGSFSEPKRIETSHEKNENKNQVRVSIGDNAVSEIEPILFSDELSIVMIKLITGKTHQIRAHLSSIGYPILGDPKYGEKSINKKFKHKYQLLHSFRLDFHEDAGFLAYMNGFVIDCMLDKNMPAWYNKYYNIIGQKKYDRHK